jgi:hypothetical protein
MVSLLLAFPPKTSTHSSSPHTCYMPCSFHPSWFESSNFIWQRVQVMKQHHEIYKITNIGDDMIRKFFENSHECWLPCLRYICNLPGSREELENMELGDQVTITPRTISLRHNTSFYLFRSYNKRDVWSHRWLLPHNCSTPTQFVLETATDNGGCSQWKLTATGHCPVAGYVPTKGYKVMRVGSSVGVYKRTGDAKAVTTLIP